MRVKIREWDHSFSIDLEPEGMNDAAMLIRMGLNQRKDAVSFAAYCNKGNVKPDSQGGDDPPRISGQFWVQKKKQGRSTL